MSTFQIDFGEQKKRVVGIDLGTTNSLIAYMDLTSPKIVEDGDGRKIVPSVVSLDARAMNASRRSKPPVANVKIRAASTPALQDS